MDKTEFSVDFIFGLKKLANSVVKKAESNLLADKRLHYALGPDSCLGYTSILIRLLLRPLLIVKLQST